MIVTALLVLAMDVSSSVTLQSYELQRDATAQAFRTQRVQDAIQLGPEKCIGVTVLEWSTGQQVTVPWTLICTPEQAVAFADALSHTERTSSGMTFVGNAVTAAIELIDQAPWQADRKVIDVSGDGPENGGQIDIKDARAEAMAKEITINGLSIQGFEDNVHDWYLENVRTPNGFCFQSVGPESFIRAIELKISLEIS